MRGWFKPEALEVAENRLLFQFLLNDTVRYVQAGARNDTDRFDRSHSPAQAEPLVRTSIGGSHPVVLRATRAAPTDECRWTVDGVQLQSTKCRGVLATFVRSPGASRAEVTVSSPRQRAARSFTIEADATRVREHLIVGMGDSFASGEGNPDIPYRNSTTPTDQWPRTRDADAAAAHKDIAYWLDRGCHRSLYGAQARAVIHLAAEFPKREFAFLSVSCSGAAVYEGVLGGYLGVEASKLQRDNLAQEDFRDGLSQINQVRRDLCADTRETMTANLKTTHERMKTEFKKVDEGHERIDETEFKNLIVLECNGEFKKPIDALLLSIGGNDVGFSSVAKWVTVQGSPLKGAISGVLSPGEANEKIEAHLAKRYSDLAKALSQYLGVEADQVIRGDYPTPSSRSSTVGRVLCDQKLTSQGTGFEMLPVVGGTARFDVSYAKGIDDSLVRPLNEAIPKDVKWRRAQEHVTLFEQGHGICQPGCDAGGNAKTRMECRLDPFRSPDDDKAQKLRLRDFDPFAVTARWFRTPNDVSIMVNTGLRTDEVRNACQQGSTLISTLCRYALHHTAKVAGAFHPNALGHAVVADAYRNELIKLLKLKEKP